MSYYNKLVKDRENREKYEKDVESLKEAIFQINTLASIHDGEFIQQLVKFIEPWKNKKI